MNFTSLTAEKIESLMAHLHKEAVLSDSGILALAVIEEILIRPETFHVRLRLTEILLLGEPVGPDTKRAGTVGAAWPHMNIEGERWSSSVQGASWTVLASEPSVAAVRRFCQAEPDLDPMVRYSLAGFVAFNPDGEIPAELRSQAIERSEMMKRRMGQVEG